jgi:hypothetical protein
LTSITPGYIIIVIFFFSFFFRQLQQLWAQFEILQQQKTYKRVSEFNQATGTEYDTHCCCLTDLQLWHLLVLRLLLPLLLLQL